MDGWHESEWLGVEGRAEMGAWGEWSGKGWSQEEDGGQKEARKMYLREIKSGTTIKSFSNAVTCENSKPFKSIYHTEVYLSWALRVARHI